MVLMVVHHPLGLHSDRRFSNTHQHADVRAARHGHTSRLQRSAAACPALQRRHVCQAIASPLVAAAEASPVPPPAPPAAADDADLEWQEWHDSKRCERCGEEHALRFFQRLSSQPDGHATYCYACNYELRAEQRPPRTLLDNEYAPGKEPAVCSKCNTLLRARFFAVEPRLRRGRWSACLSCQAADRRRLSRREVQIPAQKTCSRCREQKPAASFNRGRHSPDGLRPDCRSCQTRQKREAKGKEVLIRWPVKEQRCTVCGVIRPAADFSPDVRTRTGLKSECKQCHNK